MPLQQDYTKTLYKRFNSYTKENIHIDNNVKCQIGQNMMADGQILV